MVHIHPDNNPGGAHGWALERMAEGVNSLYGPLEELSDQAVLAGAEHGEMVDPHPALRQLQEFGDAINVIGAAFVEAVDFLDAITELSPDQLAEALPELREHFPTFDFAAYYATNRKREPGRVGRVLRPALRALGIEPPYWK